MQHDLQRQLVRRVLAHVEHRTTDRDPGPTTLPVDAYLRDDNHLLRELPVAVAHASQLAKPGDFLTHDASGVPLLIVRGDDGGLAAFVNACRHRGTRVEPAECGHRKAFTCPYHAWSYRRDGSLLHVPHAEGFAGHEGRGLTRVPVAEAAGLVFVRPAGGEPNDNDGGTIDIAAHIGPFVDELDGYDTATSHVYAPRAVTKELSWKLAIDIFLEAYHLRTAHRDSIYPMFFDNLALVDRVGPHVREVIPKRTIASLAAEPENSWQLRRHANILFHVFPNTLVLVQPDHTAVLHIWPIGTERSLVASYTLVPEPPSEKARAYWDANNRILYDATDEDFAMGESIQRGLRSGANREVVFGAYEHALAHFHRQIEAHRGSCARPPA